LEGEGKTGRSSKVQGFKSSKVYVGINEKMAGSSETAAARNFRTLKNCPYSACRHIISCTFAALF
jgi:hypothetical protein